MIIFDLDGTLSLVGDRIKYLQQNPKNWDAFYEACDEDKVNEPIAGVYRALEGQGRWIKIVTGRRESVREKTLKWFDENQFLLSDVDLHMRADGDYRHDTLVKPELIKGFADSIECIFEDRASMVKRWRELGYTCLQVAEGDF